MEDQFSKKKTLSSEDAAKLIKKKQEFEKEYIYNINESVRRLDQDMEELLTKKYPVASNGSGCVTQAGHFSDDERQQLGKLTRLKMWWSVKSSKGKLFTMFTIFALSCLVVFGLFLAWVGRLDGILIKSTIEGDVISSNGEKLEGVLVYIDNEEKAKTDENGIFKITNLRNGHVKIKLEKNGYTTIEERILIDRYKTNKNFEMIELEKGRIKGQIDITHGFDFSKIEIIFANQVVKVDEQGKFESKDEYQGNYSLEIRSPEFVDILTNEFALNPGVNTVKDIDFIPAADINAKVLDWVNDEPVTEFTIENFDSSKFAASENGLEFKDFTEIDKLLKLKIKKPGFIDQVKEQRIILGENDLGTIYLYRDTKVVYSKVSGGKRQIFSVNFNGKEGRQLIQAGTNNWDPIISSNGSVLFVSDRTGVSLVYSTSEQIGETQITTNTQNLKKTFINLKAGKLVNSYFDDSQGKYILELGDISGENSKEIYTNDVNFDKAWISDIGGSVFFLVGSRLYRYGTIYGDVRILTENCLDILAFDESGDSLVTKETGGNYYLEPNKGWHNKFTNVNSVGGFIKDSRVYLATGSEIAVYETGGLKVKSILAKGVIKDAWTKDNLVFFQDGEGVKVSDLQTSSLPKKII